MAIEQLSLDDIEDVNKDYSKETTYNVATAFGFNRNKDRKKLALDAGITNYSGQASENLKILKMLLDKLATLKNQADQNVMKDTKGECNSLKEDILNGGILPEVDVIAQRTTPQYMPTQGIGQLAQQDINIPTPTIKNINENTDNTTQNNEKNETILPTITYKSKKTSEGVIRGYEQYPSKETSMLIVENRGGFSFNNKIPQIPIFKKEELLTKFMESAEWTSLFDEKNKNIFDFITTNYTSLSHNEDINDAINDEILTYINDTKKNLKIKLKEKSLSGISTQRNPSTGNLYFDIPTTNINLNRSDNNLSTAKTIHLYADHIVIDEKIVMPQKLDPKPIEAIPNNEPLPNTIEISQSSSTEKKEQVTSEHQLDLQNLEKNGTIPTVLTEDILMNYDLNSKNYPDNRSVNYPGTNTPYSDVYQYLYGKIKKEWEGKNITFTSPSHEEISGNIGFVGGNIVINTPNGDGITITTTNEIGPDYIIFLGPDRQHSDGPYVKYKLTKTSTNNNTIVANVEVLAQEVENTTKKLVVENNISTTKGNKSVSERPYN